MGKALEREKKTVRAMIDIYCRENHVRESKHEACASCEDLKGYTKERLDKCVFGDEKPVCAQCPIHCYQSKRREEIKTVMHYSGPRMILWHPYLALIHLLSEKKKPSRTVLEYVSRQKRA